MPSGAAVIVENRAGEILLLQRGPTAPWHPGRWNLPGGHVEPGETSAQAATRELHEEANLRVLALVPVVRVRTPYGLLDVFYVARWTGRVRVDAYENVAHVWMPPSRLPDMAVMPPQDAVLRRFAAR